MVTRGAEDKNILRASAQGWPTRDEAARVAKELLKKDKGGQVWVVEARHSRQAVERFDEKHPSLEEVKL